MKAVRVMQYFVLLLILLAGCGVQEVVARNVSHPFLAVGPQGRPLVGATISAVGSDAAAETLYAASTGTATVTAVSGNGIVQFWAEPDTYTVTVSGSGVTLLFSVALVDTSSGITSTADTDNTVIRADGAAGNIQDSGVLLNDSNEMYDLSSLCIDGSGATSCTSAATSPFVVLETTTSTSADTMVSKTFQPAPATNSSATYIGDVSILLTGGTADLTGLLQGKSNSCNHGTTGTASACIGNISVANNLGTGTITEAVGLSADINNASTGTITAAKIVEVGDNVGNASGTLTDLYGIYIDNLAGVSTNTPYSFYSSATGQYFYHAGSGLFGTATSPTNDAILTVAKTSTSTATTDGMNVANVVAPSSNSTATHTTLNATTVTTGANNIGNMNAINASAVHAGTGTVDEIRGIHAAATVTNASVVGDMFGVKATASNTGTAATSIANLYGILVTDHDLLATTVAATYGVYIGDQSDSSATYSAVPYGIYQEDTTSFNYFGGLTSFGERDTTPNATVHIDTDPITNGPLTGKAFIIDSDPLPSSSTDDFKTAEINSRVPSGSQVYEGMIGLEVNVSDLSTGGTTGGSGLRGVYAVVETLAANTTWDSVKGMAAAIHNTPLSTQTITTAKILAIENLSNTGTITDTYALHIGDVTSGTQTNTAFSLYASDPNAFTWIAGDVKLGGTATVNTANALEVVSQGGEAVLEIHSYGTTLTGSPTLVMGVTGGTEDGVISNTLTNQELAVFEVAGYDTGVSTTKWLEVSAPAAWGGSATDTPTQIELFATADASQTPVLAMTVSSDSTITVATELTISGVTGSGQAVCVKSDGDLGTCSDAPNGSGVCTCA